MPSYVVTGSSKGLGFAFLQLLSKDPTNTVIGLARSKSSLESKLQASGINNVHVLEADVGDLQSMKKAAEETAKITGGRLDVLINNAALVSEESSFTTLVDYDTNPETQEQDFLSSFRVNVLGLIHSVQTFLPLIKKGSIKKVINISTGMADINLINAVDVAVSAPYSASKAAANVVIAKYSAALKPEGVLFLSISPGVVATETNLAADPKKAQEAGKKFVEYAPHFTRMLTPEESVTAVLGVIEQKSIVNGDGGSFISHLGNQQWL